MSSTYRAAGLPWGCSPSRAKKLLERHNRAVTISISEDASVLRFGDRPGDWTHGRHNAGEARFTGGFLTSVELTLAVDPASTYTAVQAFVDLVTLFTTQYGECEPVVSTVRRDWPSDDRGALSVEFDLLTQVITSRYASGSATE